MSVKLAKGYKGGGMEGVLAQWYANITEKDMAEYQRDAQRIAALVPQGGLILDLAPGPGYLAIELAKFCKFHVTGLDISSTFVDMARAKSQETGVMVNFRLGNASEMPFHAKIFDFIVCKSAFKNFADPVGALNEMYRVLKVGGTAQIIDLRGDASLDDINRYVDGLGLSTVNTLITKLTFKTLLMRRAYTQAQFKALVAQSDFRRCEIQETLIGVEVWLRRG